MSGKIATLYEMCLEEAAHLCKTSYWNASFPFGYNPFSYMPAFIIDALVVKVSKSTAFKSLESSDLRLLLTSGRVENFILEDVNVTGDTLQEVLLDLSTACKKLEKICLRNVFINIVHRANFHMQTHTLNILLSEARNVKEIESCLEFNLEVLSNSTKLQKLILNFPVVRNNIFDFLEINGQLMPNTSLKLLEIFENPRRPISYIDIAVVLRYCTELTEISCDIARSLQYLHGEELFNGTISVRYKLKRCCMGTMNFKSAAATRDEVYIASLTCPDLEDLCLLVNDDQAIYALSEFCKIKFLLLQWEKMDFGDYSLGVQLLLEKPEFGSNLTSLFIVNFTNIDFSSIGICCPNLDVLKVEYDYENNRNEFSPTSFKKLKQLCLENVEDLNCQTDTLVGILSNATELKSIVIYCAGRLTDGVLNDILKQNSLSKVTNLRLSKCVLTIDGIRKLVSSLKALEYFDLNKTSLDVDEIAHEIHEINPRVIISSSLG